MSAEAILCFIFLITSTVRTFDLSGELKHSSVSLCRVRYILNVTREIDNFFPGMFEYHNIRVYDEEATNLLEYWNDTYKFITKAK